MTTPRLTQFSPGAGCGCKIASKDLDTILKSQLGLPDFPNLLVGNSSKDDAAVYDIGNNQAVVSTTDFFTPIVDSPTDFGRIASVNAISDIFAMGGKPIMAIAILGWPVGKLELEVAQQVIDGARTVCSECGIPLAGGHSIDIGDPIFGLAVTGIVPADRVKQNNKATSGCRLFLTKPIGIGIVSTAEKRELAAPEDVAEIVKVMTTLNSVGSVLAEFDSVKSMTDITGFGLLGHMLEMVEGSGLSAEVDFDKVPLITNLQKYIDQETFPGGLFRNFKGYGEKASPLSDQQKYVLCDPQTSGGLLVAVEEDGVEKVVQRMQSLNQPFYEIGRLKERDAQAPLVQVI